MSLFFFLLLFSTMCDDSDFTSNLSKYRCQIARSVHFKLTSNSRVSATLANPIQSKQCQGKLLKQMLFLKILLRHLQFSFLPRDRDLVSPITQRKRGPWKRIFQKVTLCRFSFQIQIRCTCSFRVHTMPNKFKNGVFSLKANQMFSVDTKSKVFILKRNNHQSF